MTLGRGNDEPVIGRVLLLADESAQHVIAGLSQLDRLLRTLEECFAAELARGAPPQVVVWWKTAGLIEQRTTRLPVSYRAGAEPVGPPAEPAQTLLLGTRAIFKRGALARLLGAPERSPSFALLAPADFPADWESLAGRLGPVDSDSVWTVESSADIPRVQRQLLRATGKASDGLVSRTLNRPLSRLLSRLLLPTRVTPNQISFLVLSVLAASTWMLARGTPQGFVVGILLFQLASVLDGCDGEIARAKFLETRFGAWLDTSVDLFGNFLLALAVAVGLSRQPGLSLELRNTYLLEGALTSAAIALGIVGVARARPRHRADFNDFGSTAVDRLGVPAALKPAVQLVVHLLRRDSYALVFVLFAVFGRPEWILHGLAIAVALHLPVIAWSWWFTSRTASRLKAQDRA